MVKKCAIPDKKLWSKHQVRIFSDTGKVCKIIPYKLFNQDKKKEKKKQTFL